MKKDDFREHVDRTLSALEWDSAQCQRVHCTLNEEERPVKKKLSTGMVIVIALLALSMAAALAAGSFGLLDFKRDQAENPAFVDRIVPVGQAFEDEYLTLIVNEAAFNGTTLSFTMDMVPRSADDPVFIIPVITAQSGDQTLTTTMVRGQGGFTTQGFWLPGMDSRMDGSTQFGAEVQLNGEATGDITWQLTFRILHPNLPVRCAAITLPADDSADTPTEEMFDAYDRQFTDAYAGGVILLNDVGSLHDYIISLPQPDDRLPGEKSWDELLDGLVTSKAFAEADCPVVTFTTDSAAIHSTSGQTFAFADGWHAAIDELTVTYDRVEFSLTVTRDAPDGRTARDLLLAEDAWEFAVLADGVKVTPEAASCGGDPSGEYTFSSTLTLSAPTSRITFVPCRTSESWSGEKQKDGYVPVYTTLQMVYDTQAPITDEQQSLLFSIDLD